MKYVNVRHIDIKDPIDMPEPVIPLPDSPPPVEAVAIAPPPVAPVEEQDHEPQLQRITDLYVEETEQLLRQFEFRPPFFNMDDYPPAPQTFSEFARRWDSQLFRPNQLSSNRMHAIDEYIMTLIDALSRHPPIPDARLGYEVVVAVRSLETAKALLDELAIVPLYFSYRKIHAGVLRMQNQTAGVIYYRSLQSFYDFMLDHLLLLEQLILGVADSFVGFRFEP